MVVVRSSRPVLCNRGMGGEWRGVDKQQQNSGIHQDRGGVGWRWGGGGCGCGGHRVGIGVKMLLGLSAVDTPAALFHREHDRSREKAPN